MKKLIKKTKIAGLLILTISLMMQSQTSYGQLWLNPKDTNPPTDLTANVLDENDVNLFWTEPSTGGSTSLHWDSGENHDSFGNFLQPAEFDFAAKFDPEHISAYDQWTITTMRFWLTNPMPTVKLKIWSGPNATEIYSQDVASFTVNGWTEVTLDTPVIIDASTQLWAGINVDMPAPYAVMGGDEGPAIDGYGNIYRFNGIWYSDFDMNWNIQIDIESNDGKSPEDLLGYNIYRDDAKINAETWMSTAYVDENMLNGTYDYHVTAVYDEGESDPSNSVEVEINQPVIAYADSMALVDLYNNCNGLNWNHNDLWLEGPVNEWWGVETTGTRVTGVFLVNNNLTGIVPESFGDLTALETVHLESNEITSIPESIGNLTALVELWLGWSSITSVPESFGNLSSLEELHLGFTNLGSLPESFCNLESLNWLALGDAGLNSLPENFGNLTTVENCFLWGNNLTELPAGFGGMESLRSLSLDGNQLTTLPESIGDLSNLGWLYIEQNQLTNLPESFGNLSTLDTLKLADNQLSSLPASFGDLDDLNYLGLSLNNLTELPASITDLATIEQIYVDQNQLEALPEDIGNLGSSLMGLGISNNNITSLPESMSELVNLYTFFAVSNQIENLPVNIGNMGNLHFFGIDNNNIVEVPESIGDLSMLGYIGLSQNEIDGLPETFGNLEADTVLLFDNNIPELPATMFDNQYDYLWVEMNALQFGSLEPLVGAAYDFTYDPQAMIGTDTTITASPGQTVSYTIEVSGENNQYFWYKNGSIISGQNTNTLILQNVGDDDAASYQLKVSNTVAQALTLESYNMVLVIEECMPWEVIVTAGVHTISVPSSANPNIDGESLQTGDWVGVFFLDDNEMEVCGGASTLNVFGSAVVMAYGDDPLTPEKDGFAEGEEFIWRMYQCSEQAEYQAVATYDLSMPNQELFADLGSSKLSSLENGYCQSFEMTTGWNSASSFVVADNPSVEVIMAPVVTDLIMMRNLSQIYWPEETINTIGNWDNTTGYAMKFYNDAAFDICGSSFTNKTIDVAAGWSYLPVPSECDVDAIALFEAHQEDIVFAQDLIGTRVYWPAMGIYTLDVLNPGKAYKIKTNNGFSITFPDCVKGRQTSFASRNNNLQTPWGEFNMTPSSESVVVYDEALSGLETGDIVAAFNQDDMVCGMMEISNPDQNQSLILFGDDPTTIEADGLSEGEVVSYKLYRTSTGEEHELNIEYDFSMENSSGLFYSNSFACIINMTTGITGMEEMNANAVSLYPNPAKDRVTIDLGYETDFNAIVSVFDTKGQIVLEESISNGNTQLNVSNLKQGIYFVNIKTSNFKKTVKLVLE